MKYDEEIKKLNMAIRQAEKSGLPSVGLYKRQIEVLQSAHDDFINQVKNKGYDLSTNLDIAETEIKQFTAMKQIAQKAGLPSNEYEKLIREVRVRVLGEEVVKAHFD